MTKDTLKSSNEHLLSSFKDRADKEILKLDILTTNSIPPTSQGYEYSNENLNKIFRNTERDSFYRLDELKRGERFVKFESIKFANKKSLMNIGLGDLMPSAVRSVTVWDKNKKRLGVANRKHIGDGFYYANGRYAKILDGYSFQVESVLDKTQTTKMITKQTKGFEGRYDKNYTEFVDRNTETRIDEDGLVYKMSLKYGIDPSFVLAFKEQGSDSLVFGVKTPSAEDYITKLNMFCRKVQHTMNSVPKPMDEDGNFTEEFIHTFTKKMMPAGNKTIDFMNRVIKSYGNNIETLFSFARPTKRVKIQEKTETRNKYGHLKGQALLDDPEFSNKLDKICKRMGSSREDLIAIMNFETIGKFDPAITNGIGATGLIQFTKPTAKMLKTTTDNLRKMSGVDQLDYVEAYYMRKSAESRKSLEGLYLATFYPVAFGKSDDFVIGSERGLSRARAIAKANPIFRKRGKDTITKGDVVNTILARSGKTRTSEKKTEILAQNGIMTPEKFIQLAEPYIGKVSYGYGAKKLEVGGKVDCSGFISAIMKQGGIKIPEGSINQYGATEKIQDKNAGQRGDLLFVWGNRKEGGKNINHVAFIEENLGNGKYATIESSSGHGVERRIRTINKNWKIGRLPYFEPAPMYAQNENDSGSTRI